MTKGEDGRLIISGFARDPFVQSCGKLRGPPGKPSGMCHTSCNFAAFRLEPDPEDPAGSRQFALFHLLPAGPGDRRAP